MIQKGISVLFIIGIASAAAGLPGLAWGASQCDFVERYEKRGDKVVFIKRGVGIKTVAVDVEGLKAENFKQILPPPILNVDGRGTFCNRVYASDGKNIYYRGDKMSGVAPGDFRVLAGGYARTSTELYWGDIPVPGARVESLKILGWGKATDGQAKIREHLRE